MKYKVLKNFPYTATEGADVVNMKVGEVMELTEEEAKDMVKRGQVEEVK